MAETTIVRGPDSVTISTKWKWDMYSFMLTHFSRFSYDAMQSTAEWLKAKVPGTPKVAIVCGSGLVAMDKVVVNTRWKWDMYTFMLSHFKDFNYDAMSHTVQWLKSKVNIKPKVAIVCGSGLGPLADTVQDPIRIPYTDIPNFPQSTVVGHAGELIFGTLKGVPVVCMKGRFHYYEGYPLWKAAMPIRIFKLMGVTHIILSNAAGGLNPCFKLGDIMIIIDHINMMGYAGNNPLQGPNEDRFGPRFPSLMNAYDQNIVNMAKKIATDMGIADTVHEGVYASLGGPNYETVAENKMLRLCGVDTVGMSTVHEVIVAKHCDMKIFAFSLVTNLSICDYDNLEGPAHTEVIDVAKSREPTLKAFVTEIVAKFGSM